MDLNESQAAYTFHQQVERIEQEGSGEPVQSAADTREGLVLVTSGLEPTRWRRRIAEYELAPEFVAKVRAQVYVERSDLAAEHERIGRDRVLPLGLEEPARVDSDPLGNDTALTLPGRPGLPVMLMVYPGVLPRTPDNQPDVGKAWEGSIRLKHGFAEFPIKYAATVKAREFAATTIEVVLKPDPVLAVGKRVVLSLTPSGRWTIIVPRLERLPQRSEGVFEVRVAQQLGQADKSIQSQEIARAKGSFRYERVPVSFDAGRVYPAAWHHQLTHPVQLPPPPSAGAR
jgi:hypothetical protein